MHWSRLADLVPAGAIATLTPLLGRHAAEVATVTAWPLLLFATALLLIARLARAVGGAHLARTAAVVAAVGYPATTVFMPGRIDHHGLQVVLLLGAALGLARGTGWKGGAVAGLLAAASLVVGLETAAELAALGLVPMVAWVGGRTGSRSQVAGLGGGALAGLIAARTIFAGGSWSYPACDGFTDTAWRAAMLVAAAPLILALVPTRGRPGRALAAVVGVGLAAATALAISPECLSPYGRVDPLLARLWLAHVEEAQPLLAAAPGTALGYAGVLIVGLLATVWRLHVERSPGWAILLALQLAALATTLLQLRGAYPGAMLAAPSLAAVIVAARSRGALPLVGAWAASAGMFYPLAAEALVPAGSAITPLTQAVACDDPRLLQVLADLPVHRVMAPIDAGPWILGATPQRVIAAPYHRNNAGNLASLRFFDGPEPASRRIAAAWHVRYVLACRSGSVAPAAGLAQSLEHGRAPVWLYPVTGTQGALFEVAR